MKADSHSLLRKMKVGDLKAAFSFGFNNRLVRNGGSVGVFDESGRQQIVVATDSNKILLQSAGDRKFTT